MYEVGRQALARVGGCRLTRGAGLVTADGRPLRGAGPRAREASGGWRLARGMRLSVGGFVAACG